MTHIKFNQSPLPRTFGGFVEDILNGNFNKIVKDDFLTNDYFTTFPPVNIVETPEAFVLDVVAPGFSKEDFKISAADKTISISAEKKEAAKNESDKQVRREFNFRSFKRSFLAKPSASDDSEKAGSPITRSTIFPTSSASTPASRSTFVPTAKHSAS